jgi:hypothetical protein
MTPHTRGIHVTGLVSWRRIFQMSVSVAAPLSPRSCRTLPDPSLACLLGPSELARRLVGVLDDDADDGISLVSCCWSNG